MICRWAISPVRAARATAVAADRHVETQAASTAHTMSTTDTATGHGSDIDPYPTSILSQLARCSIASPATDRASPFRALTNKGGGRPKKAKKVALDHETREDGLEKKRERVNIFSKRN
jgi:hypothetical protein